MTETPETFKHQAAVFEDVYEALIFGTGDEWKPAAERLVETAVDTPTGYSLACGLVAATKPLIGKITDLGQVPVTSADVRTRGEAGQYALACQFVSACYREAATDAPRKPAASLQLFWRFETDQTGKAMALLFAFLCQNLNELGQQVKQALIDAEATR